MYATARTDSADSQRADAQDARHDRHERHDDCQYMRALERANEVRLARAELKRRVAAGAVNVAEIVLECPWEAQSMAVSDLLTSQRRWGHTRCRKLLAQVPLTERKTLGSMTDRQRHTLAALLSGAGRVEAAAAAHSAQQAGPLSSVGASSAEMAVPPVPAVAAPRRVLVTA
jgi:hypothetical protein